MIVCYMYMYNVRWRKKTPLLRKTMGKTVCNEKNESCYKKTNATIIIIIMHVCNEIQLSSCFTF